MSLIQFNIPEENISLKDLANSVAIIMKELQWAINGNLDVKNIRANSVNADRLIANTITALQIMANSITADKMDVTELSAISANLGHIIAGLIESIEIYGSYIATANGTYPRIELSSIGNLLGAFLDATHSLRVEPNVGGAPGIGFYDPSGLTGRLYGNSGLGLLALINNVELGSLSGKIDMNAPLGVSINGVSGLLGTKVYYVSDTSGGAVSRKLTFTNGLLTSET